jgi:GntR family transcriptional regulator/MocR family aminotransferase
MEGRTSAEDWTQLFRRCAQEGMSLQDQIRQMLVSAILDDQLSPQMSVTSCRKLADQLGVARNTVVLAYQQLADEGYLVARERSGYYVNPDILDGRVNHKLQPRSQPTPSHNWDARFRFRPSAQRNIVKVSDWQRYPYPFIYGQFDPSRFPIANWRECCMKVLSVMEIRDWAPDLIVRDNPALVEQIRTRVLPRRGVWASEDEIVVTIGAQQALYLLADLLVTESTRVGMEDPGYPDARNIFANRTAFLYGLEVDEEGLVTQASVAGCDYVYVTPNHQCPTTVSMSMERREALLRLANDADFILIEDDYESESSYSGSPIPALKSIDRNGRVVYIGSLSKSLAPGLRLGYIVASPELINEIRALRRLMVRHPATFIQRSFSLFLSLGHHDALVRRLSHIYAKRAGALMDALTGHLPQLTFVPISGGAACWVQGPDWLDCHELARMAERRGVLIEPGDVFFLAQTPPLNCFRLGFTSIPADKIEKGIRELGAAMRELESRSG